MPAIFTVLKVILTILLLPELLAIKLRKIKHTMIKKKYIKPVQLQQESQQLFIIIFHYLYTKSILITYYTLIMHAFMFIYLNDNVDRTTHFKTITINSKYIKIIYNVYTLTS